MTANLLQRYRFLFSPLLSATAALFRVGVGLRHWSYRWGVVRSVPLKTKVVSIGNISAGGSGKTPLVAYLARRLAGEGKRVCVVTRGYRGKARALVALLPGERPARDWMEIGDEARWLQKELPAVPLVIHSKKYQAARWADQNLNPDVLLIDDGFQHQRLTRDFDLVMVTPDDLDPNNHLLPRGRLRERPQALARAGFIFLNATGGEDESLDLLDRIRRYAPETPLGWGYYTASEIVEVPSQKKLPVTALDGAPCLAFSGIGRPHGFAAVLARHRFHVVAEERFFDHYPYRKIDIQTLVAEARRVRAEFCVTTEKDAVRLAGLWTGELPLYAVRAKIVFAEGEERLWQLLKRLWA